MGKKIKIFFEGFNIKKEAQDLGIKIWQTPSFLSIIMGTIVIFSILGVFFLSNLFESTELLVATESLTAATIFIIGNFIIRGVEGIARANKLKTEFVSIASHQLKTPLSEINWEIELLLTKFQGGLTEKQKVIINEIQTSSHKMVRLVNDLLDVARIDQGRLALNFEEIDLVQIAQDVVKSNEVIAKKSHVKIILKTTKKVPLILGDKRRIWVVFDNLISNGVKYIEKRGQVTVSIESDSEQIHVKISDNGVGIPKNQFDKMFQKFFRINSTGLMNHTEGTGLGLFIAKNIIEQSGGSIGFTSKEGKGTTFYFTLPTAQMDI